mmetsp:Transcript_28646/g.62330  ORF Transcript_28646/g.62330 Transcript_28646/m.62330 type:complete len:237 (-) Transcript_28646:483-1193(-)
MPRGRQQQSQVLMATEEDENRPRPDAATKCTYTRAKKTLCTGEKEVYAWQYLQAHWGGLYGAADALGRRHEENPPLMRRRDANGFGGMAAIFASSSLSALSADGLAWTRCQKNTLHEVFFNLPALLDTPCLCHPNVRSLLQVLEVCIGLKLFFPFMFSFFCFLLSFLLFDEFSSAHSLLFISLRLLTGKVDFSLDARALDELDDVLILLDVLHEQPKRLVLETDLTSVHAFLLLQV